MERKGDIMRIRAILLGVILCLVLAACTLPPEMLTPQSGSTEESNAASVSSQSSQENGINVVQTADLGSTVQIDILEIQSGETVNYKRIATISDEDTISAVVSTLDVWLPLQPGLRCPDQYQIEFILSDGRVQILGYFCEDPLAYLRGESIIADGQAIEAPTEFAELFAEQISQN
jgi:hypothetical protein